MCRRLAFAIALAAPLAAQTPELSLRIVSPGEDAYVSGPVMLRALIDPLTRGDLVTQVNFFADGRLVCQIPQGPFECAWDAGPGINEHHVRAVGLRKDGGRLVDNVHTKGAEFAEHVEVDVVQVTVVVTDRDGRFVNGLGGDAFRLFEDNAPRPITYFAAENIPLDLIVAIDVSSSMSEAMPKVKEAVKRFLAALRPDDRVTLLAFNHNIFTLARREHNASARMRAVDRLAAWGGTALYDVIAKGLDMLGHEQGRRALVVFTDGEDQSSHISEAQVLRRVEASDATVFVIGQGRGARIPSLKEIQNRLAQVSGGRAFQSDKIEQLTSAFGDIVEELSHQYLLGYPPVAIGKQDNAWREIRVEMSDPVKRHRIRARQGYRAGPVTR
ncbi:MAG: VWA domain-containing protein [Acidobacteria bacterium]|nr:VWA domain-containing protein [Acidobacteriota bacterium]